MSLLLSDIGNDYAVLILKGGLVSIKEEANMIRKHYLFHLLIVLTSMYLSSAFLNAQNNIYDRIGIISEHGLHGAVPEENIDLYSGNLTLRYLDISLPGPNGLNLNIWRVYNSKMVKDRETGGGLTFLQHEPYSWVGMGWVVHMGRVHSYDSDMPTIEFPDGKWETAYVNKNGPDYVTKSFLRYNRNNHKLYFLDGTIWTFDEIRNLTYEGRTESVRLLTKIENSFGQSIIVTYKNGLPVLDVITDALGRTVIFNTDTNPTYPKLTQIKVKNYLGNDATYTYTVGTFTAGYYKLDSFKPPELTTSSTFAYNSNYELTTVNTCYGGTLEFTYADQNFYFDGNFHATRVVAQKRIRFVSGGLWKTWNFSYPSYQNSETGIVIVDGPEYDTSVTYNGYIAAAPWKTGLMVQKTFSDNSYSEAYEWTPQEVSVWHWVTLIKDMGPATAPLLQTKTITKLGDSSSKEEYLYERDGVKKYGLATRINYFGNSLSLIKNYNTLRYYLEDHSSYETRNLISYVGEEKQYAHDNALVKQTQTHYYEQDYYWGAIDWIKRLRSQGELLTWDYTYSYPAGQNDPSLIRITVDLPGTGAGTETNEYRYGVLSKVIRPGSPAYTEINRTISQHDSSIVSETNQHDGTISFEYDNLGRIKKVDFPSPFYDITVAWYQNYALITQSSNVITKYWDGLGRDLGYREGGDGIYLYSRKTLDSEGRVVEESKQSKSTTNPSPYKYLYVLNAAGQPTRITDPLGEQTNISYAGNVKTVTDAELRETRFEYAWLPGLVTKLTDAEGRNANISYDDTGRLTQVVYNNARTQSYSYDGLDNILTESHPETGTMSYSYNDENNLYQKIWGGITSTYAYNAGNQLTVHGTGDETVTYAYDSNGRVNSISSNLGWTRNSITYNPFGSIRQEIQIIPGLGSKTLAYNYDGYNILNSITYPDGKTLSAMNNSLKAPETVTFNSKSIISAMTYGHIKQPENMTIAGNGTTQNKTYNYAGFLATAQLKKGATILYDGAYGYDGVGNILSITSTKPTPSMNATFAYDQLNRLTSVTYTSGVGRVNSISYTYDNYGNMLSVLENGQSTVFSKTYLSSNRIQGFGYDDRGNLTSADGKLYFWDNQNRLRQLRDAAGQVLGDYLYNERGLRIFALPPAPEINIKEGSQNLPDGGSVNFVCSVGSYVDKTLTIYNLGDANLVLSGSPIITISGQDASQFSVQQQPSTPILPGGTSSFIIRFQPTTAGDKTASIAIANNDLDEGTYDITLKGINPVPEINIKQGTNNIADGGSVSFASNVGSYEDKAFSIENLGAADLILSGSPIIVITGPNADQFSVQQQPVSPVSPSGSTSFIIRFQPTSMGNKTAAIAISNNDSNENPYDITLNGHTPQPEMEIDLAWDGGTYDFGTVCIGEWWETAFTIYNYGDANLVLSGTPIVQIQGPDWNHFYVTQQPSSTVLPGQYTTFSIRFSPNQGGLLQASISIANNDADENPYDITLLGTGDQNCPNKIIKNASFTIISPAEGEIIVADATTDIRWKGAESSKYVKIEYSIDNGSTYKTVSERAQNTGLYLWKAPHDISPSCLLRISDAEGLPVIPEQLTYEFMFKTSRLQSTPEMGQFTIHAGVPDVAEQLYRFADISFIPDINAGMTNIYINSALVESTELDSFIDVWQQLRIQFTLEANTGSVWIDERLIIDGFPLNAKIISDSSTASALSYSSSVPIRIWIEDLDVRLQEKNAEIPAQEATGLIIKPLIWEGFNKYQVGALPAGWTWEIGQKAIQEDSSRGLISCQAVSLKSSGSGRSEAGENSEKGFYIDGQEFVSGPRSLKLDSSAWPVHAEKKISIPDRAPFGISEGTFAIVAGNGDSEGNSDKGAAKKSRNNQGRRAGEREYVIRNRQLLRESSQERMTTRFKADDMASDSSGSGGEDDVKMLSASPVGSFYIYSYDGKLMAEYNTYGQWVRDYIYIGNQLIAEYIGTTYYYYASDQINSTRVVTDNSGAVVYSAAYDPYGGIQKTWISTYAPTMKFSGKERDVESGLDYFGARYHANYYYRWLSTDPVINKPNALGNPQLWNLYSFCANNPVTFLDPDGREIFYKDEGIRKAVEFLSQSSQTIRDTLAFYEGEGRPNLIFEVGNVPNDPDGSKGAGNTSVKPRMDYGDNVTKVTEGMTVSQQLELGTPSIIDVRITMDKNRPISINNRSSLFDLSHEIGHADHAARNLPDYMRKAAQMWNDKGKLIPHDRRPIEIQADKYATKIIGRLR